MIIYARAYYYFWETNLTMRSNSCTYNWLACFWHIYFVIAKTFLSMYLFLYLFVVLLREKNEILIFSFYARTRSVTRLKFRAVRLAQRNPASSTIGRFRLNSSISPSVHLDCQLFTGFTSVWTCVSDECSACSLSPTEVAVSLTNALP